MSRFEIIYAAFVLLALVNSALGKCSFPKKGFANGRLVYQMPEDVDLKFAPENYLLTFKCNRGHTLIGRPAVMCFSNKWTPKFPKCIKMRCEDPPSIRNGRYELNIGVHNRPTLGSTATYFCDAGYELQNETTATLNCTMSPGSNSLSWQGEMPACRKKESCPDPGISPDGDRMGECCFTGDVLRYSCKDGYELIGVDTITCLFTGNWTMDRPLCEPLEDHCETPPVIAHGTIKGDKAGDFFLPYDEVEIACDTGFSYRGATQFVMCEEESGWEEEFGECTETYCEIPEPITNGTILELQSNNMTAFPYNYELTYVCDKDFRLIGDPWRMCGTRGWSGKTPYCEEVQCPDPGAPEHGSRMADGLGVGAKVVFKCFTGYNLLGSFERYCMPNGQWSGQLARCDSERNYCPDPGIPINGMKNSSSYELGRQIGFHCQPGYTLLGSEVRECLPNETWSGREARCLGPYDYDSSIKVSDILKEAVKEKADEQNRNLAEYRMASFSPFHNGTFDGPVGRILDLSFPGRLIFYFVFDASGSVGEHNFRKSVEFAQALVKKVGISVDGARAGAMTFSSKAGENFLPLDYTTTADVLDALDRLQYTGGGTFANNALAEVRTNLIPLTQAVLGKKKQKSVIFILTDGRANMGGDPQQEADLLKLTANVEIYCVGITGNILQDSLYKIASEPKEEHVFILQNYAALSFLIQEITNGTIDYSQCGLGIERLAGIVGRERIVGGGRAAEPWPWMAAIYFTNGPNDLDNAELQCGGSIIHNNYILTAAHCMYYKRNNEMFLRKKDEIIVKLGLTNVQNQSNVQEFDLKSFIKHPKYRIGPVFDYDIALLHLKRPIEFNSFVRPICLPPAELPQNTKLYEPKQLALATGWGHTGVVNIRSDGNFKPVEDLKELILPIQSRDRCNKSLADRNVKLSAFTEHMFCAGDGTGGNDTCQGDSGGPLMQSQQNADGYTYWTQIGITSWGIGCGLPNTYGFYTHVQRLYSWIDNTINATKDE